MLKEHAAMESSLGVAGEPAGRARVSARPQLEVCFATTEREVHDCQRLRYRVFAEEMGAHLQSGYEGIDRDHFDAFCLHLVVRDRANGEIAAYTRILNDARAANAGGFYSQTEFDLRGILPLPGPAIEIGRTCVHPEYRRAGAIAVLWAGLARYMAENGVEYMMGCASIGMQDGGYQAHAIMRTVREQYLAPESLRVTPRLSLPPLPVDGEIKAHIPPLLKTYLRAGVYVCGEACWDPDFNVADLFVLLDVKRLEARYARHFVERAEARKREAHAVPETTH
jgi:putative hemolysin